MLLAIDVGNSNTVIGLFQEEKILQTWRISTNAQRTTDEYGVLFRNLFQQSGISTEDIHGAIIACVVPPLQESFVQMCWKTFGIDAMLVGPGIKTGMALKVDQPQEVGADRIVNAIAAYHQYGGPTIVVDFGTATTFDPVDSQGSFLGGVIAPGPQISATALFQAAAKLPRVEFKRPRHVIGKNTVDNIQSGLFFGYLGLVEGILNGMFLEMEPNVRVISTGGLGALFADESELIEAYDESLTLKGLSYLFAKNGGLLT